MPLVSHTPGTNGHAQMNGQQRMSPFAGRRVKNYRRHFDQWFFHPALRRGQFRRWDVPAMLMDNAVAIGVNAIYGPLTGVKFEVRANSKDIKQFVESTIHRFWTHDMPKVVMHYVPYGTSVCEVLYEHSKDTGLWHYAGMDDFHVDDCQALHAQASRHLTGARITYGGFSLGEMGPVNPNEVNPYGAGNTLRHPKLFWCAHRALCGEFFGRSALIASWDPWMEKCGEHGAISIRKLWAFSNSFRGILIKYPVGGTQMPDGKMVDNQDIAREAAELASTGAAIMLPSTMNEQGKPLWEVIDPRLNGEIRGLMEYPTELDKAVWQGMGVPDEVITAPDTGGAWSGNRPGPLLIYLNLEDTRAREIITAFDVGPSGYTTRNEQAGGVIRPLVMENFGPKAKYEIRPVSLIPKPAEPGAGGTPGSAPGAALGNPAGPKGAPMPPPPNGKPVQLSQADVWVELPDGQVAAILTRGGVALSTDASGHEHKGKGEGGGQFAGPGGSSGGAPTDKPAEKPKHGARANTANTKYQELIAQAKQARIDAFNEVKKDAEEANTKAHENLDAAQKSFDAEQAWDDENPAEADEKLSELQQLFSDYDEGWSAQDRFAHLKEIEVKAKEAIDAEWSVDATGEQEAIQKEIARLDVEIVGHDKVIGDFVKARDQLAKTGSQADIDAFIAKNRPAALQAKDAAESYEKKLADLKSKLSDQITTAEFEERKKHLGVIITHARAARQHLKAYVQHRKEMQAIKSGEEMDVQLSMVMPDDWIGDVQLEDIGLSAAPQPLFTGIIKDSLGRTYHFVNGERVPGQQEVVTHAKATGTKAYQVNHPQPHTEESATAHAQNLGADGQRRQPQQAAQPAKAAPPASNQPAPAAPPPAKEPASHAAPAAPQQPAPQAQQPAEPKGETPIVETAPEAQQAPDATPASQSKPSGEKRKLQYYSGQIAMSGSKHARNLHSEMISHAKSALAGHDVEADVTAAGEEAGAALGHTLKRAHTTFMNDLRDNFSPEELGEVAAELDDLKNEVKSHVRQAGESGMKAANAVIDYANNAADVKTTKKQINDAAEETKNIANQAAERFKQHQKMIVGALMENRNGTQLSMSMDVIGPE